MDGTILLVGTRKGLWIGRSDAARANCERQRRQKDQEKTTRLDHCCDSKSLMYSSTSRSVGRA